MLLGAHYLDPRGGIFGGNKRDYPVSFGYLARIDPVVGPLSYIHATEPAACPS